MLRAHGASSRALLVAHRLEEREETAVQNDEQVYSRYRSQLLAFIKQRVGDPDLAEDVLHDVFLKVVGRQQCLREPAKITAWLYQVTRNAIIDRLRSSRPHAQLLQEIADDAEEPTAETRLASFLRPMIEVLPQIYRDAVLSDLDGVPLKQIAKREGITVSAIKSRVQRGRRMLEALLHDCCTLEFSRRGEVMDFWPKAHSGCRCHDSQDRSCAFALNDGYISGATAVEPRAALKGE